jgi:hypothetical protein
MSRGKTFTHEIFQVLSFAPIIRVRSQGTLKLPQPGLRLFGREIARLLGLRAANDWIVRPASVSLPPAFVLGRPEDPRKPVGAATLA